jgi:hypothetical protein
VKIRTPHRSAPPTGSRIARARQRGQGLVMFVGAIVFFIGFLAIVVDVTWYWMNTLKVQRAADAAALAGAVKLPDFPSQAQTLAFQEATKNGYTTGVKGATVTAAQNPSRDIQLDTSVTAPVNTFFMHLFGINTITASRRAAAEYVLPVPMGSPLNYFGVYGSLRTPTGYTQDATDPRYPGNAPTTVWTNPSYAFQDETIPLYATVTNFTSQQQFGGFGLTGGGVIPANVRTSAGALINGAIQLQVRARAMVTGCSIGADLSWNGGTTWTTSGTTPANPTKKATLTTVDSLVTLGPATAPATSSAGDATNWWGHSWTYNDFSDASFRIRLQAQGGTGCTTGTTIYVDSVTVIVTYQIPDPNVAGPSKEVLGPQGAWAGILAQGSDKANGDPYATKKDGSGTNTEYSPTTYYDYAVEMQPGTTNGKVSIFDPAFCATAGPSSNAFGYGMGDHYYNPSSSTANTVNTYFDLYVDSQYTPYDLSDDPWVAGNTGSSSSSAYHLFTGMKAYDSSMWDSSNSVPSGSPTDCKKGTITNPTNPLYWHNRWWTLATGLAGPGGSQPLVYRIRVRSTDPANASLGSTTDALNNFSIFATIPGKTCPGDAGCPRVYGLGSMVAFSPLPSSAATVMYLAQIGTAYAGKTMKVTLYDPGDTGSLSASLRFMKPTSSGYTAATFSYTAKKVAANGASCDTRSGTNVTSVQTNNGGTSYYNGCWLTINIPLASTYVAATPAGEPGPGWWKIEYTMGSGSTAASDLTTWKTQMVGNPVHLVVP